MLSAPVDKRFSVRFSDSNCYRNWYAKSYSYSNRDGHCDSNGNRNSYFNPHRNTNGFANSHRYGDGNSNGVSDCYGNTDSISDRGSYSEGCSDSWTRKKKAYRNTMTIEQINDRIYKLEAEKVSLVAAHESTVKQFQQIVANNQTRFAQINGAIIELNKLKAEFPDQGTNGSTAAELETTRVL